MPFAQQLQEVDSTLASCALEPGEELIAYMSAVPVLARMPRAGIVHIDVVGHLQPAGERHEGEAEEEKGRETSGIEEEKQNQRTSDPRNQCHQARYDP